jgi:hypothetical protein
MKIMEQKDFLLQLQVATTMAPMSRQYNEIVIQYITLYFTKF